jgi:hypothetical protein
MTEVQLEIVSILERLGDDFSGLCLTWIRRQAIIFQEREETEIIDQMMAQLVPKAAPKPPVIRRRC